MRLDITGLIEPILAIGAAFHTLTGAFGRTYKTDQRMTRFVEGGSAMSGGWRAVVAVVACGLVFVPNGSSQAVSARLEGLVQDQSQAVIPGVSVVVINEATNITHESVTNETGRYVLVALPPGTYRVEAELPGFKKVVRGGVLLQVGDARTVNITLEPGDVSERVTVIAETPLMDLTTTKIGAVIEQRQILELPLNGRNAMALFYLAPGVNPLDQLGSQQQRGSTDGLAPHTNNLKIEGINSSPPSFDYSPSVTATPVPMEAVGEYRITTSGGLTDAGRGSGAKVSVFLKSGTNEFHGSVFEFNRNTVFAANNFFTNRARQPRPVINRNQFGFSLGGPIIKNKTFFFGTAEWSRQSQAEIQNRLVYTATLRTGIFRHNTQRANSVADVDSNGNPVVPFGTINLLTADTSRLGLDTVFLPEVLRVLPLPNNYDIGDGMNTAGYRYTSARRTNIDQQLFKIDHEINSLHHLSFSASRSVNISPQALLITGVVPGVGETRGRGAALRMTSSFTPRITNELSIGTNLYKTLTPIFDIGQNTPGGRGNIQLVGLGTGNIYGTGVSQAHAGMNYGFSDTMTWIKSNHTLSFGGEYWREIYNRVSAAFNPFPVLRTDNASNPATLAQNIPGLTATDRAMAQQLTNDLTGTIGSIAQAFNVRTTGYTPYQGNYMPMRGGEWSFFIQDIWKARRNLTLNLGVRYDFLPPGYIANGTFVQPVGGVDGALGVQGSTRQPTRWGFADNNGRDIINTDKNNFAPTMGFSWDPFGQGETTISGSYGIAYDRLPLTNYAQFSQANYGSTTLVNLTPFARLSDPGFYGRIMPIPAPQLFAPLGNTRDSRAYVVDPDVKTPYVQNWSFRVAQQIGTSWKIEASYVGNHAVGMWRAENLNQIEMRRNGFLDAFRIAQRNLAANGSPTRGESLGALQGLFALVPASQNNNIATGQAAAVADFLDTTTLTTGVRGGLITAAGLPATFFRFNPQVTNLNVVGNRSHSTWNGMKLSLTRQMRGGLHIQGNYTLGKGFTDYIPAQGLYEDYRDNANPRLDKAIQDLDSTHALTVNWLYELPFGRGRTFMSDAPAIVQGILGGWQINGIQTWVTGRPLRISTGVCAYSIVSTSCASGRFTTNQAIAATPNFTGEKFNLGNVNKSGPRVETMTAAQRAQFSNPTAGYQGDLPRVSFRGPGYTNLDMSLFKKFSLPFLGEAGEAQFRIQLYNALNQAQWNDPDTNINSGSFGVITSARQARVGEIALKIVF